MLVIHKETKLELSSLFPLSFILHFEFKVLIQKYKDR